MKGPGMSRPRRRKVLAVRSEHRRTAAWGLGSALVLAGAVAYSYLGHGGFLRDEPTIPGLVAAGVGVALLTTVREYMLAAWGAVALFLGFLVLTWGDWNAMASLSVGVLGAMAVFQAFDAVLSLTVLRWTRWAVRS